MEKYHIFTKTKLGRRFWTFYGTTITNKRGTLPFQSELDAKSNYVMNNADFSRSEDLPEAMVNKHYIMFWYVKFFQRWIKPVLAEFCATWMLVFWACMIQPPPNLHSSVIMSLNV